MLSASLLSTFFHGSHGSLCTALTSFWSEPTFSSTWRLNFAETLAFQKWRISFWMSQTKRLFIIPEILSSEIAQYVQALQNLLKILPWTSWLSFTLCAVPSVVCLTLSSKLCGTSLFVSRFLRFLNLLEVLFPAHLNQYSSPFTLLYYNQINYLCHQLLILILIHIIR